MRYFSRDATALRFAMPDTKLTVSGICELFFAGCAYGFNAVFSDIALTQRIAGAFKVIAITLLTASIIAFISAVAVHCLIPDNIKIKYMVRKSLYCFSYGNPLHLKDGERLPSVKCTDKGLGVFYLTIKAISCTVEDIQNISSSISSSLNKKRFNQYAVVQTDTDIAFNNVTFRIEDVTVDRSLTFLDVNEMKQNERTMLAVQKDTYIDLTTSGSILTAGKTRSGKTTGIISLLLQALLWGRDNFGSEITIIDPKQAELSRLPHVVTLDENGEAKDIIAAMKHFAETIVKRQKILNDLSEQSGDAVNGGTPE